VGKVNLIYIDPPFDISATLQANFIESEPEPKLHAEYQPGAVKRQLLLHSRRSRLSRKI
jgi:hypothetical protein